MDDILATQALSALGHQARLAVFRLLVTARDSGLLAGEIAEQLDMRQNTLSSNLAILQRNGLIASRREGRAVRYFADINGAVALIGFLLEDCCGGDPTCCQPTLNRIANRG